MAKELSGWKREAHSQIIDTVSEVIFWIRRRDIREHWPP